MRVLFTTWAWPSHYLPLVPLGWALSAAGHDVRVAAPPSLTELIKQSGLTPVAVGTDVDFVQIVKRVMNFTAPNIDADDQDWQELRKSRGAQSLGMFTAVAEAMVDDLIEFSEQWRPDLIVYDATTYAGPMAAAKIGVPAVRHLFGPDLMYRGRKFEPEVLEPLCSRLGITDLDTIGALTIDPCPPSLQTDTAPSHQRMRYVPYNGPGEMPRWLLDPPPRRRVCVTSGTSIPSFGSALFIIPQIVEAIAGEDVEVVVAVQAKHRHMVGEVPSGVLVTESLPLRLLLPTCDAVIHHGGAGTSLTSLLHGLPQMVVAQLPDQLFTAGLLAECGAARTLTREEMTADRLRAELSGILTEPSCRAAAQSVRGEMLAQPTATEIVGRLEKLA